MRKIYLFIFAVILFCDSGTLFAQGPCSGTPAANTALASSTVVCTGSSFTLSLQNAYNNTGVSIQWMYSSVSNVGPFTPISGATNSVLITNNPPGTGYYTAVITCVNGNGNITATPVFVTIQSPGQTYPVPYYEGFGGITYPNELPNCSWTASNLGGTCLTYTSSISGGGVPCTGQKFAAFSNTPTGTSSFFTNGLQLQAGVIYSASIWFHTGSLTSQNWSNLSLLINSSQNSTGASTVASAVQPISAIACKNLSGTFTVATSGDYYLGICATSTASGNTSPLYFDDVSVTIPCTGVGAPNSPTISVSLSSTVVCMGQAVTATITGAHIYYPPLTNSVVTFTLNNSSSFTYVGTNTLTGCMSTKSVAINVNPSPTGMITGTSPELCFGESATLTAFASANEDVIWSTGEFSKTIVVTPTVLTVFAATVSNQFGCQSVSSLTIDVNPLPNVGIVATKTMLCLGDEVMLSGTGAFKFQWVGYSSIGSLVVSPTANTTYSLTGMSQEGCFATTTIELEVFECVGVTTLSGKGEELSFFPNPVSSKLMLQGISEPYQVFIYDQYGRLVLNAVGNPEHTVDLKSLSDGVYTLQIRTAGREKNLKVIKQ